MPFQVPDVCTLPTAEQPLRQTEFEALCTSALRGQERVTAQHLRLTLRGGADLLDRVQDLAARESLCCSFFDFTITATDDVIVLDIGVPAEHSAVLDGLGDLASSSPTPNPASSLTETDAVR